MHIRRSPEEIAANRARYEEHQKKGLEFAPKALPAKSARWLNEVKWDEHGLVPVIVDGELLAVTLYRKGAEAVARAITNPNTDPYVTILEDSPNPAATPHKPTAGVATYRTR